MKIYKRKNKIEVKNNLINLREDEIEDQIEMQHFVNSIFGDYDYFDLFNFEDEC